MTIVTPLHAYFSPAHLEHVVAEMRRRGPPRIRAFYDATSGGWFALEGTHRLRAALRLGITPVMVPVPWPRSRQALANARYAALARGHRFLFLRVDIATFDPAERAREKAASREEDARAIASGEKTMEQLRVDNGSFAFPRDRVRICFSKAKLKY